MPLPEARIDIDTSELEQRLDRLRQKATETDKSLAKALGERQRPGIAPRARATQFRELHEQVEKTTRMSSAINRGIGRGARAVQTVSRLGQQATATSLLMDSASMIGRFGAAAGPYAAVMAMFEVAQRSTQAQQQNAESLRQSLTSAHLQVLREGPNSERSITLKSIEASSIHQSISRNTELVKMSMSPLDKLKNAYSWVSSGQPSPAIGKEVADLTTTRTSIRQVARSLGYDEQQAATMGMEVVNDKTTQNQVMEQLGTEYLLDGVASLRASVFSGWGFAANYTTVWKEERNALVGQFVPKNVIKAETEKYGSRRKLELLMAEKAKAEKAETEGTSYINDPQKGFEVAEFRRRNDWLRREYRHTTAAWNRD